MNVGSVKSSAISALRYFEWVNMHSLSKGGYNICNLWKNLLWKSNSSSVFIVLAWSLFNWILFSTHTKSEEPHDRNR